jgi:hypothetical protein
MEYALSLIKDKFCHIAKKTIKFIPLLKRVGHGAWGNSILDFRFQSKIANLKSKILTGIGHWA